MENSKEHEEKHSTIIIVNTREKEWNEKEISYDEVIKLAFDTSADDENVVYTVTYAKGENPHEGSLVKGKSVKVKKGMIFNVTKTRKS